MKTKDIKKIEIKALEWFDKANGNSYFAAIVWINENIRLEIPFSYGYGDYYMQEAKEQIKKQLNCFKKYNNSLPLWRICKDNKIELIANKKENCKKVDLKNIDKIYQNQ